MNKKAQLQSLIIFIISVVLIISIAPIFLRVWQEPLTKTAEVLQNVSGGQNGTQSILYGRDRFTNLFDKAIVVVIFINILILWISAFLIDVHPAFVVVYIIGLILLFFLYPVFSTTTDKIYSMPEFTNQTQQLTATTWIAQNSAPFFLIVAVISGILLYSKLKFFPSQQGGSSGYYG